MSIESLNGAYYRLRAVECLRLADKAQAAKPLFKRLFSLAKAYEEKAMAVDSTQLGEPSGIAKRPCAVGVK
jgi:hypothetical protein